MKQEVTGWIILHRKIQESRGYFSEAFCRNMAWIDLLLLANHCDNYFYVRGIRVDVKRGQCGYSEDSLAKRWGWSRGKVRRFLKELEKDQQIVQQKNNITTLLSIVNYDEYQQVSTAKKTASSTAKGQQTDINKELIKNDKEVYTAQKKFYDDQCQLFESHELIDHYRAMIGFLFGKNDRNVPFDNVLQMDQQISFSEFVSMGKAAEENGISIKGILSEMENYKDLRKKNISAGGTAANWIRRNGKKNDSRGKLKAA